MRPALSTLRPATYRNSCCSSHSYCSVLTAPGRPFEFPRCSQLQNLPWARRGSTAVAPTLHPAHGQDDEPGRSETAPTSSTSLPAVIDWSPLAHLKLRGTFLAHSSESRSSAHWSLHKKAHPVLDSRHYGKWQALLFDYDKLMVESGLAKASPGAQRSIDHPEHFDDVGLWSAVFNFAQRRQGRPGAIVVWSEIFNRRALFQTEGVVAEAFWQTIVESALEDEAFLESTWAYAEWMREKHGAQWPNYYRSIVSFCLDSEQYDRALRWHLRLSPHFGTGRREFFNILRGFLFDTDPRLQGALQSIYATSAHRQLYDTIVPLLWSQGFSALARSWRDVLTRHNDKPASGASRPFLKYLAGYYPETRFCAEELSTMERQFNALPDQERPVILAHLVNRAHGDTFGIKEKTFNDKMGAKWFATTWVALDTAINAVYTLGIDQIGPLSLQSIALREHSSEGILHRLRQLELLQISVGESNYVKAIRHLAKVDDFDTLRDLLYSSLHPDVFDDAVLQRYILGQASFKGDWKTYRLVFAVRVAVSDNAMVNAGNTLLVECLERKKKGTILKLLDELGSRGIEILPSTSDAISHLVLDEISSDFDPNSVPDTDFYAALCRRIASMRLPVATEAWRNILFLLGRQGRLEDLEKLALDIMDRYRSLQSSAETAMKVHRLDVPEAVKDQSDLGYCLLPRDIPLDHPLHPASLIFSKDLAACVVRWFWLRKMAYRQAFSVRKTRGRVRPSDFYMAGGVKLLSMLRDRGLDIPISAVRHEALVCIATVFGPRLLANPSWRPARSMNQLTLKEVKGLCDSAWGSELLPAVEVLEKALRTVGATAATLQGQIMTREESQTVLGKKFLEEIYGKSSED